MLDHDWSAWCEYVSECDFDLERADEFMQLADAYRQGKLTDPELVESIGVALVEGYGVVALPV